MSLKAFLNFRYLSQSKLFSVDPYQMQQNSGLQGNNLCILCIIILKKIKS